MLNRGCASSSPAVSQNQLGQVKAICDLARLASGVYCTIIIINNTNLINFLQFSMRYQTWFLGNKVHVHTLDETQCLHTHTCTHTNHAHTTVTRFCTASSPEPTGEICADICDQMSSMSWHKNVKTCRSTCQIALIFFYRIWKNII